MTFSLTTLAITLACLLLSTSGVSAARSTDASQSSSSRSLTKQVVQERLSFNVKNDDIWNLHKFAEWTESFHDDNTRHLQATRPCGEEIGRTTASEIKQVLEIYVSEVIAKGQPASEAFKAREALSSLVKYDFVAMKVCSACSMVTEEMLGTDAFNNQNEHGFQTYCGPESYGYDAVRIARLQYRLL
jgi:cytochrome c556